jgi:2-polyprenyl-3-methyl-5-hydroxy-6-metoxy-1,4-benzoquinol methylase
MSNALDSRRACLYKAYSTTHAGRKRSSSEQRVVEKDILPRLPPRRPRSEQLFVDIGCGQGRLVEQLVRHGFTATRGIDISAEQVALAHAAGIDAVECGDYRELLSRHTGTLTAVIATDFLEHLTKDEVVTVFDNVRSALHQGGVFVVRSPNATSPFFGNYQFSDFTHETILTPRSFAQLATNAGYTSIGTYPCTPVAHGVKSTTRLLLWCGVSTALKIALAAETGETGHIVTQNFVGVAIA